MSENIGVYEVFKGLTSYEKETIRVSESESAKATIGTMLRAGHCPFKYDLIYYTGHIKI